MNFTENHLVSILMVSFETHFVGMTGFEPATTRTPCAYATRLRHIPDRVIKKGLVDLFNKGPAGSLASLYSDFKFQYFKNPNSKNSPLQKVVWVPDAAYHERTLRPQPKIWNAKIQFNSINKTPLLT